MIKCNKIIFLIIPFVLISCGDNSKLKSKTKSHVFIPGPDFFQSLEIRTNKNKVTVGEEVTIQAVRQSGGWLKILQSEIDMNDESLCKWKNHMPPSFEKDVSSNIAIAITPEGYSKFNVGLSAQDGRSLKISKAGVYEIVGFSAAWCQPGIESNKLILEVVNN